MQYNATALWDVSDGWTQGVQWCIDDMSIDDSCTCVGLPICLLITASVSNKFLAHTLPEILEAPNSLTTFQHINGR